VTAVGSNFVFGLSLDIGREATLSGNRKGTPARAALKANGFFVFQQMQKANCTIHSFAVSFTLTVVAPPCLQGQQCRFGGGDLAPLAVML